MFKLLTKQTLPELNSRILLVSKLGCQLSRYRVCRQTGITNQGTFLFLELQDDSGLRWELNQEKWMDYVWIYQKQLIQEVFSSQIMSKSASSSNFIVGMNTCKCGEPKKVDSDVCVRCGMKRGQSGIHCQVYFEI